MHKVGDYSGRTRNTSGYVVLWDNGEMILTNHGQLIESRFLGGTLKNYTEFGVSSGVYTKLAKLIEGVRVSEFLKPGDVLMIFSENFLTVTLDVIVEKDFENNCYVTKSGKVLEFGSIMAVYANLTIAP